VPSLRLLAFLQGLWCVMYIYIYMYVCVCAGSEWCRSLNECLPVRLDSFEWAKLDLVSEFSQLKYAPLAS